MAVGRKLIQVIPTQQPNRVLVNKPTAFRRIIPEQVVMQSRLLVKILILKSERLMCVRVNLVFCLQAAPGIILPRPQQVAELVGLFSRDADLVGVVVGQVEFLVFVVVEDVG